MLILSNLEGDVMKSVTGPGSWFWIWLLIFLHLKHPAPEEEAHRQRHRGHCVPGGKHPLCSGHDTVQLPTCVCCGAGGEGVHRQRPIQGQFPKSHDRNTLQASSKTVLFTLHHIRLVPCSTATKRWKVNYGWLVLTRSIIEDWTDSKVCIISEQWHFIQETFTL